MIRQARLRRCGSRSRQALVAEQFLELIDDDQQVLLCAEMGLFDQRARVAAARERLEAAGTEEAKAALPLSRDAGL